MLLLLRRYRTSVRGSKAEFPGLGYWGGDEPEAVDFYVDTLRFAYDALVAQVGSLDTTFVEVEALGYLNLSDLFPIRHCRSLCVFL